MEGQKGFNRADSGFNALTSQPSPPKKRIIVCCDGTWQSANHGLKSTPSNIAKISRSIATHTQDDDGTFIQQIVWYDAGVGTGTDSVNQKIANYIFAHQGTWGEGLDENVCEAYHFLVNNYNSGDELYFFGFSRGAYTARAAAGLVARIGISSNAQMDDFYKMYAAYKTKKAHEPIANTDWAKTPEGSTWLENCDHKFSIKCVGVFDTVGALGWPTNVLFNVEEWNKPFAFHNTDVHPEIENAFQALALDEHRAAFPPTLWSLPEKSTTRLIQCWFPGYHINSGGGSGDFQKENKERKGDFEAMANITFCWMVDRIQQYTPLGFNRAALTDIIERYARNITDLVDTQNTHSGHQPAQVYRGWGIGPSVDSYNWKMALAGSVNRTPAEYNKDVHKTTHEHIHPVVAWAQEGPYRSKALNGFVREKRAGGKGYVWKKTYTPVTDQTMFGKAWSYISGSSVPAKEEVHLEMPEWAIQPDRTSTGEWECKWGEAMERHLIRADTRRYLGDASIGKVDREKVARETIAFLRKMDADNGFEKMPESMYDPLAYFNILADNMPDDWTSSGFHFVKNWK